MCRARSAQGGEPLLGRADAIGQARTIEALYRSAAEGCEVELGEPPAAATEDGAIARYSTRTRHAQREGTRGAEPAR